LLGGEGFRRFPQLCRDTSTLVDDHQDVLLVKALETSRILVRRLSTEGDEDLIIRPGVQFRVERDLAGDDPLLFEAGMRLDHFSPDAALDVCRRCPK
jgi:hypothetical protein